MYHTLLKFKPKKRFGKFRQTETQEIKTADAKLVLLRLFKQQQQHSSTAEQQSSRAVVPVLKIATLKIDFLKAAYVALHHPKI